MELSDEEEEWLTENRMKKNLPDWYDWKRSSSLDYLSSELIILNRQTSSEMRKEQRLKFENWTRTIQEAADKGKIGKVLKKIMNENKDSSLEVLYGVNDNMTDATEIAEEVTRHFGGQFSLTQEERRCDVNLSRMA